MGPKLDCQKLRGRLSEYFFVASSFSTKFMSQNHPKIEHPEIGNTCYGYQNSHTRCHLQGETSGEVSFMFLHHLLTFRVDLRCDIDNLPLLEPISRHKTRVDKTVNLYNYLRFCGNGMCTVGPNSNLWLTEATGMDTNGSDVLNDDDFTPFLDNGGVIGPYWCKTKNWRFGNYGNFGDKNHHFHLPAE